GGLRTWTSTCMSAWPATWRAVNPPGKAGNGAPGGNTGAGAGGKVGWHGCPSCERSLHPRIVVRRTSGGEPDEGEPHVRFGEGPLETGKPGRLGTDIRGHRPERVETEQPDASPVGTSHLSPRQRPTLPRDPPARLRSAAKWERSGCETREGS